MKPPQKYPVESVGVDVTKLAHEYMGALRRFFERRILEHADVEDLVQEVFLHLSRRGDLSHVDNVEGYLFQTAANVLRDRFRQKLSYRADSHGALDPDQPGASAFTPERVLMGKEGLERMIVALQELPERTRTVFVLRRFEELRPAAIAERLGTSLSTVEKEMASAVAHLIFRVKEYL